MAQRAGGVFASVFRARNPRANVRKMWFIPKHRMVLVSKFTHCKHFV